MKSVVERKIWMFIMVFPSRLILLNHFLIGRMVFVGDLVELVELWHAFPLARGRGLSTNARFVES